MNIYNNGDKVYTVGDIERIERENSELKAQVELLRKALEPFATGVFLQSISNEEYSFMHERIKDWLGASNFKKACVAYDSTPAQCLAEIKAQAGHAGFMAGVECVTTHDESTIYAAEEYANQIRQQANGGG
jgi:hypothetical protein